MELFFLCNVKNKVDSVVKLYSYCNDNLHRKPQKPFLREVALNDDVTRGSGATEGDSNRPCRKLKRCCPDVDRQDFTTSGQQGVLKTFCIGCDFTSGLAVSETVSY